MVYFNDIEEISSDVDFDGCDEGDKLSFSDLTVSSDIQSKQKFELASRSFVVDSLPILIESEHRRDRFSQGFFQLVKEESLQHGNTIRVSESSIVTFQDEVKLDIVKEKVNQADKRQPLKAIEVDFVGEFGQVERVYLLTDGNHSFVTQYVLNREKSSGFEIEVEIQQLSIFGAYLDDAEIKSWIDGVNSNRGKLPFFVEQFTVAI